VHTNPAQRLHDVLSDLSTRPSHEKLTDAWKKVLPGVTTHAELLLALSEVHRLPRRIVAALHALNELDEATMVDPWFAPVSDFLGSCRNLDQPLSNIVGLLDREVFLGLKVASFQLRNEGDEVPTEQVAELKAALAALEEAVTHADDLPPELVRFLMRRINEMSAALQLLPLTGMAGFQRAFEGLLGECVVRHATSEPMPDPESTVGKRFADVMTKAGTVVAVSNGVIELGTKLGRAIAGM
jgi:hypothetical protein